MMDYINSLDWSHLEGLFLYNPQEPMIFSSGLFFLLFLLFLPLYGAMRRITTLRILYVLLFSLFFYYKSSGLYVLILLVATTSDFIIGRYLAKQTESRKRKRLVLLSMCINLGVLAYFKYFNFLGDLLTNLLSEVGGLTGWSLLADVKWKTLDIFLPVGISFYTFQTMSYIIDLYRGEIKPLRRWIDYVFYVSFFPQLVAGPIVRAKDFIPQIHRRPLLTRGAMGRGLFLVLIGLFKKAVISDYISLNFVDRVFDAPQLYSGVENLMALYGYAMQIYCDFSGYSDMAIGIALFLGFRFNINFNVPYNSATITEFWRRWHISLSTWLKDYLYIPMGGNRKGKLRAYINLIITMLLGGLWHGAALRFILWGAFHGVALALHKMWLTLVPRAKATGGAMQPFWRVIGIFLTFHFVLFTWIFFRASDMQVIGAMLHQIGYQFHPELILDFIVGYGGVVSLILLGYCLHFLPKKYVRLAERKLTRAPFFVQLLLLVVMIFIVFQMKSAEVQPFIYFQF